MQASESVSIGGGVRDMEEEAGAKQRYLEEEAHASESNSTGGGQRDLEEEPVANELRDLEGDAAGSVSSEHMLAHVLSRRPLVAK